MDQKTDNPEKGFLGISSLHIVHYRDSQGKLISIGGMLYRPAAPGKYPAVILCHGFNGHHTDFPMECASFAGHRYVCYAFDFCGAQADGLSIGRTASEYTPYTMVEDLKAVVADLRRQDFVGDQIFLFGGSQGGLVTAMVAGRLVWGCARFVIAGLQNTAFPLSAFWAGAVADAVPGIILHIVLIPVLVMAMEKAHLTLKD